jgi:hypothetical protein
MFQLFVEDFAMRYNFWSKEVAEFGEVDTIPHAFFKLCSFWQIFFETSLHPPVRLILQLQTHKLFNGEE